MAGLLRRYGMGARFYDVLSGERLVYRAGRTAGVELLGLHPGDAIVDLGCGTGLNFAPLLEAAGPDGVIVGIDRSADMLAVARRRITAAGWERRVTLLHADASTVDPARIAAAVGEVRARPSEPADALFATYALSVIAEREEAWERATAAVKPGGRAAVVDMQPPTGFWRILSPLARLACATGGADIRARPWRLLERDADPDVPLAWARRKGGHIVAVAGSLSR